MSNIFDSNKVPDPKALDEYYAEQLRKPDSAAPVVREDRDTTDNVNPETGRINPEQAAMPQPEQPQPAPQGDRPPQEGNQPQPTPQGEHHRQEEAQPQEEVPAQPLRKLSSFQGKKAGYFDLDTEDGFWKLVDKKIDEAFEGSSPDDVPFRMTVATITLMLDAVANYVTHSVKERKRLDKEFKDNLAENDKQKGITADHKNLAMWLALADHPGMRPYQGKPVNKDTIKAAHRILMTDPRARKTALSLVASMTGRELTQGESRDLIKNVFESNYGLAKLTDITNAGLNDSKLKAAYDIVSVQQRIADNHAQAQLHRAQVRAAEANRANLDNARGQNPRTPTPRTNTNTASRQGREAA